MTFHFLCFFHRTVSNLFFCCGPISRQLVLLAPKRWVTSLREDAEVIEVEGRWDCPLHTQIFQPWRWTFEYSIEVDAYSKLGGGGDTPLYKPYRYVPLQRVVFAPFWSENWYRLCLFWSGIGYGCRGNYGSVWTYLSFQFQISKKEREICEFEMNFKKYFLLLF